MDRRTVLQAAGATLLAGGVPAVAASAEFEPRSRLALPGAKEAVVAQGGGVAYVATPTGSPPSTSATPTTRQCLPSAATCSPTGTLVP